MPETNINNENTLPNGYKLENYIIIRTLGAGGFGITYLARDNLDSLVAIKEYMPRQFASRSNNTTVTCFPKDKDIFEWGLERFLDEAKTLRKFDHPSIVKVLNFFRANNTAYFVMPFYEGETLEDYLEKNPNKSFSKEEILQIIMPILEGLKEVHKEGFLHRDIAPDNIFLRKNKLPVLIDFGASRNALGGKSQTLSAIVKAGYSPPEQYTSISTQDATTDIYAICAVMYKMITGKKPPESTDRQTLIFNGQKDPIEDIVTKYKDKYPKTFLETIQKGLNLKQKDRVQSIEELQEGLINDKGTVVLTDEEKKRIIGGGDNNEPPKTPQNDESIDNNDNNKENQNALLYVIITILAIALIGVGVYLFTQKDNINPKPPKPTPAIVVTPKSCDEGNTTACRKDGDSFKDSDKDKALALYKKACDLGDELGCAKKNLIEKEKELQKQKEEELKKKEEELKRKQEELRKKEEELKRKQEEKQREEELKRQQAQNETPQEKHIYFNENGINIDVTYPSFVRAGEYFTINAEMTNRAYRKAKQGGLTLSFPDMIHIPGEALSSNFSSLKGYSYPDKIYNNTTHRNMTTKYFMVEGWQSRPWYRGETKYFSVKLKAPKNLNSLRVNVRGILWIRNHRDSRAIPTSSMIYDQQGFPVKQFEIKIKD